MKWAEITVQRGSYRFPNYCANCLRPNPDRSLRLQSDQRKLKAHYLVAAKYEVLRLEVPFCDACASRQMRWQKLGQRFCWMGFIVAIAVAVYLDLDRLTAGLLGMIFSLPAIWLLLYRDWAVRVKRYGDNTVTLAFKRREYARQFSLINESLMRI